MQDFVVIPPVVRSFLERSIGSVEELSILVWLDERPAPHGPRAIAEALHLELESVHAALQVLANQGLVVRSDTARHPDYQIARVAEPTREALDALRRVYYAQNLELLMQISSNAITRARTPALKMFSEAPPAPPNKKGD